MSRTRRLSLRARMLVMLIGVTTVLLLVMGTVSTYLLAQRVDAQILATSAHLSATATSLAHSPRELDNVVNSGYQGPAIVEVSVRGPSLAARPASTGTLTNRLADAIKSQLAGSSLARAQELFQSGHPDAARELLFSTGCGHFPNLSSPACKPTEMQQMLVASRFVPAELNGVPITGGPALLFIAEPITTGPGAVRGFIIAELITGTALIALLALAGEWLIGRGLIPLDEMTRTANEITSRGDLAARMPEADDQTEVGRLGSSINTMLDRIQQAFSSRLRSEQKVREFAADASHELRTPLTTIRGYAELYRQGALGPDQLPNAMRRIEQEAERMSTLVAELLELARLDRTSSLDLAETDLAGVVRDAVADAVAVEPQRPVHAEAPPRLVAVVDEPRIRQVLANLLGNVRTHTPVSTPVAVRLGAITGGVLIEVADAGPGMSTQDAIRAFDRFHRAAERMDAGDLDAAEESQFNGGNAADWASASPGSPVYGNSAAGRPANGNAAHNGAVNGAAHNGAAHNGTAHNGAAYDSAAYGYGASQDRHRGPGGPSRAERTSGSGLGLSIVQAIANAHGGRATLESLPGQGTKVRVWLPVRIVP